MATGRKRQFDEKKALNEAMLVFWEKGYAAASLTDLTAAMGINKPSMYAVFGNKEQLHRLALEYYGKYFGSKNLNILSDEHSTVHQRLRLFLSSVANMQFDENYPKGCLVSSCVSETATGILPSVTVSEVKSMQSNTEDMLKMFFNKAKSKGQLDKTFETNNTAMFISLLIHGSAVMARSGKNKDDIEQAFTLALSHLNLAQVELSDS